MKEKISLNGNTFTHGSNVLLQLDDCTPFNGTICIENNNRFFVCHDNPEFDGSDSPVKFKHKYSWVFTTDNNGALKQERRSVKITPVTPEVVQEKVSPKFEALKIEYSLALSGFIDTNFKDLQFLFKLKLGILDPYDRITDEKDGFVELHSKERKKKLKIKLGRLLRKLITSYNKMLPEKTAEKKRQPIELKDELIEEIHNKWTSFNTDVSFVLAKGEEVLQGYSSKNYLKSGNLTSCMTDRFNDLKLYTKNPDQINLMIFYFQGQVCGRTIIWNCDDGKSYHDRVYSAKDSLTPAINDLIKKSGFKNAKTSGKLKATLKKADFANYPYLDTFRVPDLKSCVITN